MQAKLVASDDITGRAFIGAFEHVPVVLMSEDSGTANDVIRLWVTMGVVDFLHKPLSLLRVKNIWQHAVRRVMQRTSLYDAAIPTVPQHHNPYILPSMAPAYSEPAPANTNQPSISNCLPSSMTAPISPGLAPPVPCRSSDKAPTAPHRSSVDSPGSAQCPPLPAGYVWKTPAEGLLPPPLGVSKSIAPPPKQPASIALPAPPLPPRTLAYPTTTTTTMTAARAFSPFTFPLRSNTAPVLLKSRPITSSCTDFTLPSLPSPHTTNLDPSPMPIPDGFLSLPKAKEEATTKGSGLLGLKLRKSSSLLNLINATLSAST